MGFDSVVTCDHVGAREKHRERFLLCCNFVFYDVCSCDSICIIGLYLKTEDITSGKESKL